MDAVTGISGSGPGFLYYALARNKKKKSRDWLRYAREEFEPELARSARAAGFGPDEVKLLVSQTSAGSIALLKATKIPPEILCKQVTSKKGTTEAGLKELKKGFSVSRAVKAAVKRAKELSRG